VSGPPTLSLVVPVKDERENLRPLAVEVRAAMEELAVTWELLLVDDGSTDGSWEVIREIATGDPCVRGIRLDANHGQTAAFLAGFARAQGDLVVTMDADLQNDPRDIGGLLAAIAEGSDMAVGVRRRRRDSVVRRASSRVASAVRSAVLGDGFADVGCSLKAYRRAVLAGVPPLAGMHRFLPVLARWQGFRVAEVAVGHRPRRAGRSKYGIGNRLLVTFLDLLAVRWMRSRQLRHRVVEECRTAEPVEAALARRA
jgi:glycosyltransferase involved in cell wall biosynthesis